MNTVTSATEEPENSTNTAEGDQQKESLNLGKITDEHNINNSKTKKGGNMNAYNKTLVVDSSYIPRSIITADRAFVISYKGNADVVATHDESFKLVNPELDIKKPSIIRVNQYIGGGYLDKLYRVPLTRDNIFRRDNYECVYCGHGKKRDLTIDHVIPRSKGGEDSWNNLVTACKRCNNEKSDLTLEEYGKEIPKPFRPHYIMLIKKIHDIPEEWKPYLLFYDE